MARKVKRKQGGFVKAALRMRYLLLSLLTGSQCTIVVGALRRRRFAAQMG